LGLKNKRWSDVSSRSPPIGAEGLYESNNKIRKKTVTNKRTMEEEKRDQGTEQRRSWGREYFAQSEFDAFEIKMSNLIKK
jgi:hypothetical protein